jgi:hypothetical protein
MFGPLTVSFPRKIMRHGLKNVGGACCGLVELCLLIKPQPQLGLPLVDRDVTPCPLTVSQVC